MINIDMNINRLRHLAGLTESKQSEAFIVDIEDATEKNANFRKVLYTDSNMQLVVMSVAVGDDIGEEVHDVDQFIRIESGKGEFVVNSKTTAVKDGFSIVVPKGTKHNVINKGDKPLQVYAIYSPPHHKPGTVDKVKPE